MNKILDYLKNSNEFSKIEQYDKYIFLNDFIILEFRDENEFSIIYIPGPIDIKASNKLTIVLENLFQKEIISHTITFGPMGTETKEYNSFKRMTYNQKSAIQKKNPMLVNYSFTKAL